MGILLWIGFGIVAGAFAKLLMPGPDAGGIAVAIPLGILGGLVGGFLNNLFQSNTAVGFEFCSLMMASQDPCLCCSVIAAMPCEERSDVDILTL